ncbi:hypothetical protein Ancab_005980 [Ancistrocladus abbreviatus]
MFAKLFNKLHPQVGDLEHRCISSTLQWQANITALSIIEGTSHMYFRDECGSVSVMKYDVEEKGFSSCHTIPSRVSILIFRRPPTAASDAGEVIELSIGRLLLFHLLPLPCLLSLQLLSAGIYQEPPHLDSSFDQHSCKWTKFLCLN